MNHDAVNDVSTPLAAPHPPSTAIAPVAEPDWQEQLLERVVQADASPMQLAEEFGLTLPQLAHWAAQARHMKVLEHLARLADVRAHMLVSQFRANAAAQLIQIAAQDASELARKACVDLLKVKLNPFVSDTSHDAVEEEVLDQTAVLAALERIGSSVPGAEDDDESHHHQQ